MTCEILVDVHESGRIQDARNRGNSNHAVSGTPYLGPVASDGRGLVQWVVIEKLLSPEVREQLWRQAEAAA